jgi:hypothetical protein
MRWNRKEFYDLVVRRHGQPQADCLMPRLISTTWILLLQGNVADAVNRRIVQWRLTKVDISAALIKVAGRLLKAMLPILQKTSHD